jgi:hypothetical protein
VVLGLELTRKLEFCRFLVGIEGEMTKKTGNFDFDFGFQNESTLH